LLKACITEEMRALPHLFIIPWPSPGTSRRSPQWGRLEAAITAGSIQEMTISQHGHTERKGRGCLKQQTQQRVFHHGDINTAIGPFWAKIVTGSLGYEVHS